jgi:hypothetical protein
VTYLGAKPRLIVIADRDTIRAELPDLTVRNGDVLVFDSLEALDRWRRITPAKTIAGDVARVLAGIGCAMDDLEPQIRTSVEQIAGCESAPPVSVLFGALPERTFYRRWSLCIPMAPKQFLARVRLLHARRLIEEDGYPPKEAAFQSGYRSTWDLKQALRQKLS